MLRTALITGGRGFLGSHLCLRLRDAGWRVHATSRQADSPLDDIEFHQADLASYANAERLLTSIRPDVVYHFAGHVTGDPGQKNLVPTFDSHVRSAVYLLDLSNRLGVGRLILTGSLLEPSHGATPSSPYAAAKQVSSLYARMCASAYDTPAVVVRPFMTFGPGQHESKVLPYVIQSFAAGVSPRLSSGTWRADWIYVDDVIDGIMAATDADEAVNGADLDLGLGTLESLSTIVDKIASAMGTPLSASFGSKDDRPAEPERSADIQSTFEAVGWRPRVSLDEGLARTIDHYAAS